MANRMFSPQAGSPAAELAANITDTDTVIPLVDVSIVPAAPNILTMQGENSFETIIYEEVDEGTNELKQVTRGVEGTAQSWTAGQEIARNMTAQDIQVLQNLVFDLLMVSDLVEDEGKVMSAGTLGIYEDESDIVLSTGTLGIYEDEGEVLSTSTTA